MELTIGEETYARKLEASGDTIPFSGDPYLEETTTADLFAFLLEANEARRAVALGQNLRELIMRLVDTDEIQDEIDRLKRERRQIEDDIDELEQKKRRLPKLEAKRSTLQSEIEQKQEEYEAKGGTRNRWRLCRGETPCQTGTKREDRRRSRPARSPGGTPRQDRYARGEHRRVTGRADGASGHV